MTDAIVIGAGHNGLVCAAYLAKSGVNVTVLEASGQVGGAAITREFAPGFQVSAGAHLLNLLDQGIARDLQLSSHGLSLAAEEIYSIALEESGQYISIAKGSLGGPGALDEDHIAIKKYHRQMDKFAGIIGNLHNRVPARMGTTSSKDLIELARLGMGIRRLGKDDMREFLRITGINVYDVLQERFESELLKGALSLDGTLGTFLGTRSNNSVFAALHRMSNGGKYQLPKGGMGSVTQAIAAAAQKNGAEIRTSSRVSKMLVDFDRVAGVELENGEQIKADMVLSSADPKTTFLKLLGARHLEAGFAHRVNNIRTRGCVAKLHLALDGLPSFTGLDADQSGNRLLIAPDMQYVEHAFNHAKYGEHSAQPVAEINIPTLNDSSLAPEGQHVLSANVQWAPYDLKEGWDNSKAGFTEIVIDTIARYAPDLRDKILHTELLTPKDLEQEFGMTGGHWHHAELSLDQSMMMRPVYGAAQYEAPVNGLYLCGAGSHPGGGVMGSAGKNAATVALAAKG